jgi:carbonic anhydrase
MKRVFLSVCLLTLAVSAHGKDSSAPDFRTTIRFIESIKTENTAYYTRHKAEFFSELSKGQYPIATVVSCSDSRVHTNTLSSDPEGKLYVVRNLGNQLASNEGSIEYGIHQLHTPVLLFVGHSRCGAISAAIGDYSKESPAVKRELDTITVSKELSNIDGVYANIHNQVAAAMLRFADELKGNRLTVVGAVVDLADDLHQGAGKLSIINVNGETDSSKLENVEKLLENTASTGTKKRKKNAPG